MLLRLARRSIQPLKNRVFYHSRYVLSNEVQSALKVGKPVVALESTIITHGMPYPENLETALELEKIVRDNGSIPATIALMNGKVKIGLTSEELKSLAMVGLDAIKTSRRDYALLASDSTLTGATTVSGTMIAAKKAGISVFVTGGIGGVHRGAEENMDISADLTELGRTPIAVICAGVKSILDIEKTLEFLETQGVTVVTYGKTNDFPAFYLPKSGFKSMSNLETIDQCANLILANQELELQSGMVIAVPIPIKDAFSNPNQLETVIANAVKEAKELGVRGKDITPFLLGKVKELTGGNSLKSNIALVKNNAKVGSQIAFSLAKMKNPTLFESNQLKRIDSPLKPIVIVGGSVLDISSKITANKSMNDCLGTSTIGVISESFGGVGRNMAEACQRVGGNPLFVTTLGNDVAGKSLMDSFTDLSMDTNSISVLDDKRTAIYNAVFHSDGSLIAAVADMNIHSEITFQNFDKFGENPPAIVAVDANISTQTLQTIYQTCHNNNVPFLYEPTSVMKSLKIFESQVDNSERSWNNYITPDIHEAKAMANLLPNRNNEWKFQTSEFKELQLETDWLFTLLGRFDNIVLKCGEKGCLVGTVRPESESKPILSNKTATTVIADMRYTVTYLPAKKVDVVTVNGAGDTLVGILLKCLGRYHQSNVTGIPHDVLVKYVAVGMEGARLSLECDSAVSPQITPSLIDI